ncbi:hypothetical protein ACRAWG_09595 [Methylobacterium sp. P31]
MASRRPDRSPDLRPAIEPPRDKAERDRAKTEIAAGDFADHLADFA